jgi:hypothetical protein
LDVKHATTATTTTTDTKTKYKVLLSYYYVCGLKVREKPKFLTDKENYIQNVYIVYIRPFLATLTVNHTQKYSPVISELTYQLPPLVSQLTNGSKLVGIKLKNRVT